MSFLHLCLRTYIYNEACFDAYLIQQIMVSGRQWSVPSSSIVVSTHDLYILYSVYCVVHDNVYCVDMRSVHTVQCVLCCARCQYIL